MKIERKWYQKLYWLFGLGLMVILSIMSNDYYSAIDRFSLLIWITTTVLFGIWFYHFLRRSPKTDKLSAIILVLLIIIPIFLVITYGLLNWIKCDDQYECSPFAGISLNISENTTPPLTQQLQNLSNELRKLPSNKSQSVDDLYDFRR